MWARSIYLRPTRLCPLVVVGGGRLLIEKKHIDWAELTDRLVEVKSRYPGPLNGLRPEAAPEICRRR